jgi:hypothetical protein
MANINDNKDLKLPQNEFYGLISCKTFAAVDDCYNDRHLAAET